MAQNIPQFNAVNSSSTGKYRKQNDRISVLSVSPNKDDHHCVERLLCSDHWAVQTATNVTAAMAVLRRNRIPVVICHSDSTPDSWSLLEEVATLTVSPSVIIASRLADERLWAEALNLGAYDVLAKPLVGSEITRVLGSAWLRWQNDRERDHQPSEVPGFDVQQQPKKPLTEAIKPRLKKVES